MNAHRRPGRSAALEVLPSHLRIAVLEPRGEEGMSVQMVETQWRHEASSLGTDEGRVELAAAMRQLAGQFRLGSLPVQIALSGDFCVTRVINGKNDRVRRELADLEQRSGLYLSLGHGTKATASCVAPIDARHQRAMLAVVNERVLSSITAALERAGLNATVVEPSLVSLCRLVGHLMAAADQPALVVHGTERGLEVGICCGGQLLLDYRPAAKEAKEQAGAIVGSHLHRLQRYCDRYVRVGGGKLEQAFVSGEPELVALVQRDLAQVSGLQVRALATELETLNWQLSSADRAAEFAPALGAALLATVHDELRLHPNLLDRSGRTVRTALLPGLVRTLWPAAAVVLASAVGWGYVQTQHARHDQLQQELAALAPQQQEMRVLRATALQDQNEIQQLRQISAAVRSPGWGDLASRISQCLPEDVWLDDLRVDGQGRLQLVGASFTDDGVFEFVRWLELVPELAHVALSGTRPTRLEIGPATQFDVRCDFSRSNDQQENNDENG